MIASLLDLALGQGGLAMLLSIISDLALAVVIAVLAQRYLLPVPRD
jgi:hypothetical protein